DVITMIFSENISAVANATAATEWALSSAANFSSLTEGTVECNTGGAAANECDYNFTTSTVKTNLGDLSLAYTAGSVSDGTNSAGSVTLTSASSPALTDLAGPVLTSSSPASSATSVTRSADVVLTFSEPMDTASFTYSCCGAGTNPGSWSQAWTVSNTVNTLSRGNFTFSDVITFTITAAPDTAANTFVGAAATAAHPLSFTVVANSSPVLDSNIPNVNLTEDTNVTVAFDLDTYFSDVDTDHNDQFICTASNGLSAALGTMTINSNRTVDFTLVANATGTDTIQFSCADALSAATASNVVTVTISNVNDTPAFTGTISNQTTNEDTNLSSAFDLDNFFAEVDSGDSCTYSVIDDFSKGTMTISSGAVSFAPTANATGSDTVQFRCTDTSNATVDSNSVTVTITAVNDTPSVSGPVNITIEEGTKLVILVNGADNDGDALALSVQDTDNHFTNQGITVGNLFTDAGDNSGVFDWTPAYANNGSYTTTFVANDGSTTGTKSIVITVTDINAEPSFAGTLPTVALVGGTTTEVVFDLDEYFSDADGDTLTYSVAGNDQVEPTISAGAVQLTAPTSFSGTEALTFTATDAMGATENSNAVIVSVTAGLSLETVDHVEGKTKGSGTVTVFDEDGNTIRWTAFPVGGSVPRIAEINDAGYVFVTKYRAGSTIHAYSLTGDLVKKKRLSPKLHWRKVATGDLDNDDSTEEVIVATRRDSRIYFKVYAFKPNRQQFDLLYKAATGVGPITDDQFQVTIQDQAIVLKNSQDQVVSRLRPL
ncbi:MAG: hypothetical protein ACD_41C00298G0001, partial [uncultured bacterium]